MISCIAFEVPHAPEGKGYNSVQQLSYTFIIMVMPAWMIFTGMLQAPAVANHWPKITNALGGRQVIRTLHVVGLAIYLVFIIIHVAMVILHDYGTEVSKMVFGHTGEPVKGGIIFTLGLELVFPPCLCHPDIVAQTAGGGEAKQHHRASADPAPDQAAIATVPLAGG
ncbi:MAG: cytochrome b/b6 domain-containing protein [Corynebacterium pyruviciproducens]|uniref:cytochrome b/b6 domain-containing protein n=1 Tax=Corynebacterium pyruviciproducens TaxID=598660 RepID=UPI00398392B2